MGIFEKDGITENLREDIVDEDLDRNDRADVGAGVRIDRDYGFGPDLAVWALPENTGVDRAGGGFTRPIERCRVGKLNERDHVAQRFRQADVFHMLLEVREAVLEGKAPLQR